MKRFVGLTLATLSLVFTADQTSAATLIVNSTSVVYASAPAVTASIHLTSPAKSHASVYVSPQYLNATMDGNIVHIFAYCVDILNYSGPGVFEVVPLIDYLGGNTVKYNQMAALIAANGGPTSKYADAATQVAVWEAIYDHDPFNAAAGNFWINNVHNDPTLIADANAMLSHAVSDAGKSGSSLQLFVAKNSTKQDMLFWTTSAVPEPSAWALMLVGFFGLGAALRSARRRDRPSVSYA